MPGPEGAPVQQCTGATRQRRLVAAGVHRIHCLLGGGSEIGALALEHSGYTARQGMVFYERLEPVDPVSAGVLGQLGGRMIRAGAWEQLGGMVKEKELIERRVILPLAQPQLAERLGLVPPRAIVLFGPAVIHGSSSIEPCFRSSYRCFD